ncbi:helix-turn-helix transcriptional regulator [Variovorax sp. LT1P1]|uniref:helix-turn-helix transcriptional regulator n=1 Tax=Variovorax sp. LT1P1 TaxID=3443730 RepID=UPI003F491F98
MGKSTHMPTVQELSTLVRNRRKEIGITQEALAKLSGISRKTVNGVETATIKNLSIGIASAVLEALGMRLDVATGEAPGAQAPPARSPLEVAAMTAGVSFLPAVEHEELRRALMHGNAPSAIQPHLHALLDDAPMSLLGRIVDQLHREEAIERRAVWANMRGLARQLKSYRPVWN